jgi:hypothetical protein
MKDKDKLWADKVMQPYKNAAITELVRQCEEERDARRKMLKNPAQVIDVLEKARNKGVGGRL